MAEINRRTGRPVTFGLAQSNAGPELFRDDPRAWSTRRPRPAASSARRPPRAASACCSACSTARSSTARRRGPRSSRCRSTRGSRRSSRPTAGPSSSRPPRRTRRRSTGSGVYVLTRDDVDYSADPATSLAAHAERAGESIVEAFVRHLARDPRPGAVQLPVPQPADGRGRGAPRPPPDGDRPRRLRRARRPDHGRVAARPGSCSHWVRDRGKYPIEDAIRRLTSDTAALFGIADRGVLRPGAFADVNVIDLDGLALELPELVHDFPTGAGRYVQRSRGLRGDDRERRGVRRPRHADRHARRSDASFLTGCAPP